jgi:hypothetical protein
MGIRRITFVTSLEIVDEPLTCHVRSESSNNHFDSTNHAHGKKTCTLTMNTTNIFEDFSDDVAHIQHAIFASFMLKSRGA